MVAAPTPLFTPPFVVRRRWAVQVEAVPLLGASCL